MVDDGELIQRADRESQLLIQLPCRGVGRGLTGLDLAPGQLPEASKMCPLPSARHEDVWAAGARHPNG